MYILRFFLFKQKSAYEMRISDWSSDVCSSDLGKNLAKLDDAEIAANRSGTSNDPKAAAAVRFAAKVAHARGHISDDDVQAVRMAGYSDEPIVEIVQHVALNTWTNYNNEVAGTEEDFPVGRPAQGRSEGRGVGQEGGRRC